MLSLDKAWKYSRRKRRSTLAPTPPDSCRSTSTCLSSEQAVEEASLWWRIRPIHVQIGAQRPVGLVDVDFFEALHLNHLPKGREGELSWRLTGELGSMRGVCVSVREGGPFIYNTTLSTDGCLSVRSGLSLKDVNEHLRTVSYTYSKLDSFKKTKKTMAYSHLTHYDHILTLWFSIIPVSFVITFKKGSLTWKGREVFCVFFKS